MNCILYFFRNSSFFVLFFNRSINHFTAYSHLTGTEWKRRVRAAFCILPTFFYSLQLHVQLFFAASDVFGAHDNAGTNLACEDPDVD